MAPKTPALIFTNINKSFGKGGKKKQIIQNFSATVHNSEIVGFVGPNGAGKSTVIKLLLHFYTPDSGEISVFGRPLSESEFRNKIGYLSEIPFFYNHLTANESLDFAGQLQGMVKGAIHDRTIELLDLLKLTHAANQRVATFSKGMKQRLGFAAAMIHDPPIYVFDEPMSGLDPLGRDLVKKIFKKLKKLDKTIFFSSHILSDIEELCDRLIFIHKGHILFDGPAAEFPLPETSLEDSFVQKISDWEKSNGQYT